MMNIKTMSHDEKSLLLYFETRAVDHTGGVNPLHMNQGDFEIAKQWDESGFVKFGRIAYDYITRDSSNWCELSDEAWQIAHQIRHERAKRLFEERAWLKTSELQES